MKQLLLTNWNLSRILRLIFGIVFLVQGILTKEITLIFAGILIGGMAFFMVGCCAVPSKNINDTNLNEITYEEVV